jgi:hypothetical protein
MQTNPAKKSMLQKQIPTILGLVVLVVALIAGIFFLGEGPGVFAPRATPQTTPKNIKLTNITDSGFTVSFLTDEATNGFVKYGESADEIKSQSSDDRDQLSGTVGEHQLHHVTVRGLKPAANYFYTLGTGSRASFDNNGAPFQVTTAKRGGAPSAAKTAYGSVVTAAGAAAEGSIVYVTLPGVGEMSSLVKSSNSWAIPLSNARSSNGASYAIVADDDVMTVVVQGDSANLKSEFTVTVADSQPVATVTLGQIPDQSAISAGSTDEENSVADDSDLLAETDDNSEVSLSDSELGDGIGGLDDDNDSLINNDELDEDVADENDDEVLLDFGDDDASSSATATTPEPTKTIVDLSSAVEQVVNTGNPVITGKAAPNVTISITVNSETQIEQQLIADGNGNFELDIESLKEQLEPGEHTATYSYVDPESGETVTKTVTFTVEEPAASASSTATSTTSTSQTDTSEGTGGTTSQLAQATTEPFGSGNPYTSETSPTPTATASATPTPRTALPSTTSAIPVSGSTGTTFALMIGGFFFITAGVWSYWLAREME